jgi:hypothetical protein
MENPFSSDLFSSSTPKWTEVADPSVTEIDDVLLLYFNDGKADTRPLQAGAFELNSSNFKVVVRGKPYLLKRWQATASQDRIEKQLTLLEHLHVRNVEVAPPIHALSRNFSVEYKSRVWGLFGFVSGEYFRGNDIEVASTGASIGKLFEATRTFEGALAFPEGPSHRTPQDAATLAAFGDRSSWVGILGDSGAAVLDRGFEKILETWGAIQDVKFSLPIQLVHYDLHPHNLLMAQNRLAAFLDFDACARMQPEIGLGFAALKLGRQAVFFSGKRGRASDTSSIFLTNVVKEYEGALDFSSLKAAAQMEVMRRIVLILRLNLESGERAWNHVLPVQVGHLYEIDELFA